MILGMGSFDDLAGRVDMLRWESAYASGLLSCHHMHGRTDLLSVHILLESFLLKSINFLSCYLNIKGPVVIDRLPGGHPSESIVREAYHHRSGFGRDTYTWNGHLVRVDNI